MKTALSAVNPKRVILPLTLVLWFVVYAAEGATTTHYRSEASLTLQYDAPDTGGMCRGYGLLRSENGGEFKPTGVAIGDTITRTMLHYNVLTRFAIVPLDYYFSAYYPNTSEVSDTYIWNSNVLTIRLVDENVIELTWPKEYLPQDVRGWLQFSDDMIHWQEIEVTGAVMARREITKQREFYRIRKETQ